MSHLSHVFRDLGALYTSDSARIERCWNELSDQYSSHGRYYHTLAHLEHLLTEIEACAHLLTNRHQVLFALYYHDIVYKATSGDNEEQSARIAGERMKDLGVPNDSIAVVHGMILATKRHEAADDDTNYFTDADLSILGSERAAYEQYASNVRKEYRIYPDLLYNPGRRKVLRHFLDQPTIFKTAFFLERLEVRARQNLEWELSLLM